MTPAGLRRIEGTTLWRQIEALLAQDIAAGRLHHKLPNEPQLAARFGVNRHTVRQALRALSDRGLVEVMHGRGSFVRGEPPGGEIDRRARFVLGLGQAHRVGRSVIGEVARERAPDDVRRGLEIGADADILRIESLAVVDGQVFGVCTQYFPSPRFDALGDHCRATGSTEQALAAMGLTTFRRRSSRVSARACTPELAAQLRQPRAQPILQVETVDVDAQGLPFEFGIRRFAAAAVQVAVDL